MIPQLTFAEKQVGSAGSADADLPSTVSQLNNFTSVVLSNLGLALLRLPTNSPARANITQAMQAAEHLADVSLALNDRVHGA